MKRGAEARTAVQPPRDVAGRVGRESRLRPRACPPPGECPVRKTDAVAVRGQRCVGCEPLDPVLMP